jgi:Protein of unknown function (DUF1579)
MGKNGWMAIGSALAVASGLAIGAGAVAAEGAKRMELKVPAAQPTQEEMMAAWQKSAAVGPEHALLKKYEGKWTNKVTATMDPSQPPEVTEGTSEGMLQLGGRFVHMVHHGTMMGQPFEGMMLLGYDNLRQKYTAAWVDSMSTQIATYEGTYDAAKGTFTMIGTFVDPISMKSTHTRGVTAFPTADTMTYDEYMPGPDGKEMHGLHIDYKRS